MRSRSLDRPVSRSTALMLNPLRSTLPPRKRAATVPRTGAFVHDKRATAGDELCGRSERGGTASAQLAREADRARGCAPRIAARRFDARRSVEGAPMHRLEP